ncbi:MAG: ABC transporter ATP-binding protein [Planctomycetes bacterium]|jgi:putative ABC transport system ATP-binding protein|nr:ABC transporter ATP-binding protein [Planctomycetota bacterium]
MSFIALNEVTREYTKGEHRVMPLESVSLKIEAGEFFVLLGPSGSGKTTLLNLLAGIDSADAGSVVVGGTDLTKAKSRSLADWRAEYVGYVFQQANLVPVLTAYENVELPLWLLPLSKAERHARVSLALEAVGLVDRASHLPSQMSGGQEQRVAIARAIVADPPLLLADEPTGNLDAESAEGILELLSRLNSERGKTIVMVTHDPKAADRGTRIMRLDKGRLFAVEGQQA